MQVITDEDEHAFVQLERRWELEHQLVDAVEPLYEDRGPLVGVLFAALTVAILEFVSKVEPFLRRS